MTDTLKRYQELQVKAEKLRAQVARHEGTMERILTELQEVGSEVGEEFTTVKAAKKWLQRQSREIEKNTLKLEKLIEAFEEKWGDRL